MFDAIAEVTGFDPATAGSQIGKVAASLRKADPEYGPDDVREFGRRYWEICPYAEESRTERPTPSELEKYIGRIRAGPVADRPPPARAGSGRGLDIRDQIDSGKEFLRLTDGGRK